MRSYLTQHRRLDSAILGSLSGWHVEQLGTVHGRLSPDPQFQLAARLARQADRYYLYVTTLASEASWQTEHIHCIPLPEGCRLPDVFKVKGEHSGRVTWSYDGGLCCLLLDCAARQGRTASLLVVRVGDGANQLVPMAPLAGIADFDSETYQLSFSAGHAGLPRLACFAQTSHGPHWAQRKALEDVGVELVHVAAGQEVVIERVSWAPNGSAVCTLLEPGALGAKPFICRLSDGVPGTSTQVLNFEQQLPGRVQVVWSPCSQKLLLVGSQLSRTWEADSTLAAVFCSVDGQLLSHQLTDFPQTLGSLAWSSAGLVAIACHTTGFGHGGKDGRVVLCTVSEPRPLLQVLRVVATSPCITSLTFSPCGLFVAWADHGVYKSEHYPTLFRVDSCPTVVLCKATSGETVQSLQLGRSVFDWAPIDVCKLLTGVHLAWSPGSLSLTVCGPVGQAVAPAQSSVLRVRELHFLP